jgi:renalase
MSPHPAAAACQQYDVAIVGAGISGLCAAGELARAGRRVVVLEKSRGIGGRMATRRLRDAVCDHGAQFFTVRGRAFGGIVAAAHAEGVVEKWCDGFARPAADGSDPLPAGDGHARWRGRRGMTDLPKRLAATLPEELAAVRCDTKAAAVGVAGDRVRITLEEEAAIEAGAAILSCPVPQSLDLMAAGGLMAAMTGGAGGGGGIDPDAFRTLSRVEYDPCFALMLVLDRPSLVPAPGGIQFEADGPAPGPIAWLADNQQKGISPIPSLTIHATAAFSRRHFDADPADVSNLLVEAASRWIDGPAPTVILERSLHRWKYSQPTSILEAPLVAAVSRPPIVCCGDAFAGPRVEGAASSGLAAARWVERVLRDQSTA